MNHTEKRLYLIRELLHENSQYESIEIPTNPQQKQLLLRALMNVRMPHAISSDFQAVQDDYLQEGCAI